MSQQKSRGDVITASPLNIQKKEGPIMLSLVANV